MEPILEISAGKTVFKASQILFIDEEQNILTLTEDHANKCFEKILIECKISNREIIEEIFIELTIDGQDGIFIMQVKTISTGNTVKISVSNCEYFFFSNLL